MSTHTPIQSPCIAICIMDETDLCVGCRRTMEEITDWATYTDDERERRMAELETRN